MLPRLGTLLDRKVPITLIMGQRSWMRHVSDGMCLGEEIRNLRQDSYVALHTVADAGHHVYADQPAMFCDIVNRVCSIADSGQDSQPKAMTSEETVSGQPELPAEIEWDPSTMMTSSQ